jgi:hypothetical protein
MAMHGILPIVHVEDANGDPIVGAKLHVYEVGTTNYRAIWSDAALSVALPNPLTGVNASNALGNFPRFYMAAGTYKLRAVTSADVLIGSEYDNIDTGLPSGGVSSFMLTVLDDTTAAAVRTTLSVPSAAELSDLAADITDLSDQIQNIVSTPQGYLTLTSGVIMSASDVTAGTSVYYTPDTGTLIPIWNGTDFVITTFAELTMTLNAAHLANTIYDLFVINDAGTIRLVSGPAWNTSTAGSGARGTGAGTTELQRVGGVWTNKASMTARYGATTVTVGANQGTYVGSMHMDGTNGQLTCHATGGQSRKRGIWNTYNRRPLFLKVFDATASWTYDTSTIRPSRNQAGNSLSLFVGLQEEIQETQFMQRIDLSSTNIQGANYVGYNSTTVGSGKAGRVGPATSASNVAGDAVAQFLNVPTIGLQTITALESSPSNGGGTAVTFTGTEAGHLLTTRWRG